MLNIPGGGPRNSVSMRPVTKQSRDHRDGWQPHSLLSSSFGYPTKTSIEDGANYLFQDENGVNPVRLRDLKKTTLRAPLQH